MNPHCNRNQSTWSQSEEAKDFKRIGHDHFVPNVYINGEITRETNNPVAATYVYPTDDVENDFSPPERAQDDRPTKKQKLAYNNNNKYTKYKSNQAQPDWDNDRSNTNKLSSNYKGKSKSQLANPITDFIEYARELPSIRQLLSAVLTENINDFLQVTTDPIPNFKPSRDRPDDRKDNSHQAESKEADRQKSTYSFSSNQYVPK